MDAMLKTVEMVPVAHAAVQSRPGPRIQDLYEDRAGVGPDAMTRSYRAVAQAAQ